GLLISLAGPVTYPKARALPEVAKLVPGDRLVVETDCPFLPPQPHRGQRNEPAYLTITAARVAEPGERLATQLGHARGGDREIGGLVALAPVGLGREERAVGLDDEAVAGHELRHLGERAGLRVGHRPRERDQQSQVEAALGNRRVAGEAVHDPTGLAHRPLGEDRQRLLVGVAAMDEHGLARPPETLAILAEG